MRHISARFLTLSVVLTLLLSALPAQADQADDASFISYVNQSRAQVGLGPLTGFWDLTDDAAVHTAEMLAAGQIYHSSNAQLAGYTTGWASLGENVGMGPNTQLLHQAFMNSPGHKANILGDYDRIGVATDRSAEGTMFVTVLFMRTAAPTTTTTTEAPTTTQAPTTTTQPTPTTQAPTTTTTQSPVTTQAPVTTAPSPSTTTAPTTTPQISTPTASASGPAAVAPAEGRRPAMRVAGVQTGRQIEQFRSLFAILGQAGHKPLTVMTSGGVEVTIE